MNPENGGRWQTETGRPLRVLMLAPHPFYIDRGTPIDVDLVVSGLSDRGYHVDLLTYHTGIDRVYPNVRILRIPALPGIRRVPPGLSTRKLVCDAFMLRSALRLVRRHRYDVVHAGEEAVFMAMLIKKRFGIPYVYDMDSSIAQQTVERVPALSPVAALLDRLEARAIRGSLATAPVCKALADLARSRGAAFVETLYDISQLTEADLRPAADLRGRFGIAGRIVMYVGNLERYQGIDLLLESTAVAAREVDDLALVIAGGDPKGIAAYRRKADAIGIGERTHFIGPWPAREMGGLISEADVLAVPRIRGINTPMKVFPFLHSGKPVLATDLVTNNQILDSSIAALAPADPEGFGRVMVELLLDPELRRRLGAAGSAFVERGHTREAYRARLNHLYDYVSQSCVQAVAGAKVAAGG